MNSENSYIQFVLKQAPRVISQLDRDSDSPTYGCFDRNFWHYKIRDFSSAILQQNCLTLALLYTHNFKGNPYYKKEKIKRYALAAVEYWSKIMLRDGSFNEYYPNEHSIPPTVFSLYAVCETYKILKLNNPQIKRKIAKTAKFLIKKQEKNALNQEITSMCAIYNAYLVTKKKDLRIAVNRKLKYIKTAQSKEGWFREYGGADIGYLSVSLNFLAEYYRLSKDTSIKKRLSEIVEFLQYFIHPDGSLGGDYGSRNTTYFLYNGLEITAPINKTAIAIRDKIFEKETSIDDRYMTHYVLPSAVSALVNQKKLKSNVKLPYTKKFKKYFKDAGLFVYSDNNLYLVCNLKKLGVINLFRGQKRIFADCGYRAKLDKKSFAVSNWTKPEYETKVKSDKSHIEIISKGALSKTKFYVPTPIKHIILRLATPFLGSMMRDILRKIFITPNKPSDILLKRTIVIKGKHIRIIDQITAKQPIKEIHSTDSLSLRYVPSSRYFDTHELDNLNRPISLKNIRRATILTDIDTARNKITKQTRDVK